jgi:hypothetical protein
MVGPGRRFSNFSPFPVIHSCCQPRRTCGDDTGIRTNDLHPPQRSSGLESRQHGLTLQCVRERIRTRCNTYCTLTAPTFAPTLASPPPTRHDLLASLWDDGTEGTPKGSRGSRQATSAVSPLRLVHMGTSATAFARTTKRLPRSWGEPHHCVGSVLPRTVMPDVRTRLPTQNKESAADCLPNTLQSSSLLNPGARRVGACSSQSLLCYLGGMVP